LFELFFWDFPYFCYTPLSYLMLSSLAHIPHFFCSLLSFILEFVDILSEFI
jgi:hypothetical protein